MLFGNRNHRKLARKNKNEKETKVGNYEKKLLCWIHLRPIFMVILHILYSLTLNNLTSLAYIDIISIFLVFWQIHGPFEQKDFAVLNAHARNCTTFLHVHPIINKVNTHKDSEKTNANAL